MNGKKILSLDKAARGETVWLRCCWDDCDKSATSLHQSLFHDHPKTYRCDHESAKHVKYVFCTERHRQMFLHSHIAMGKLPAGFKGTIL